MKSTKKKLKARKGILFMQSQFVFSKLIFILCISLSQVSIVLRATSHIVQSSSSIIVISGNFVSKEYNTIISDCFIYHNTMVIKLKQCLIYLQFPFLFCCSIFINVFIPRC